MSARIFGSFVTIDTSNMSSIQFAALNKKRHWTERTSFALCAASQKSGVSVRRSFRLVSVQFVSFWSENIFATQPAKPDCSLHSSDSTGSSIWEGRHFFWKLLVIPATHKQSCDTLLRIPRKWETVNYLLPRWFFISWLFSFICWKYK